MINNKCTFMGNIFEISPISMTANGKKCCKLTISVRAGKGQDGKSIYEYIPCRAYEQRAELLANYFTRGKAVAAETHVHRYKADNGTTYTEFIVDDLAFVPSDYIVETAPQTPTPPVQQQRYEQPPVQQQWQASQYEMGQPFPVDSDDLPF